MENTNSAPVKNTQVNQVDETAAAQPATAEAASNPLKQGFEAVKVPGQEKKTEAPAEGPKKLKLKTKTDGQEEELELSEEEIVKYVQKSKAADKRLEEAAKEKKEALRIQKENAEKWENLKKAPLNVLKELLNEEELLEITSSHIIEEHKKRTMTPEQRELENLRKENKKLMQYQKMEAEKRAKEEHEKKVSAFTERFDKELTELLNSGVLPVSRAVSNLLTQAYVEKLETLENEEARSAVKLSDLVPEVTKFYHDEVRTAVAFLTKHPEQVEKVLGPELFRVLREIDIAKHKASHVTKAQEKQKEEEAKKDAPIQSWADFRKRYKLD